MVPRILPTAPLYLRILDVPSRWATQVPSLSSGIANAWLGILTLRLVQVMEAQHEPPPQVNAHRRPSSDKEAALCGTHTHMVSSPDVSPLLKQLLHPPHLIPA